MHLVHGLLCGLSPACFLLFLLFSYSIFNRSVLSSFLLNPCFNKGNLSEPATSTRYRWGRGRVLRFRTNPPPCDSGLCACTCVCVGLGEGSVFPGVPASGCVHGCVHTGVHVRPGQCSNPVCVHPCVCACVLCFSEDFPPGSQKRRMWAAQSGALRDNLLQS